MNYNSAMIKAIYGEKLLLPGWVGYFYWDYGTDSLAFKNGEYHLNSTLLDKFELNKRNDWYQII